MLNPGLLLLADSRLPSGGHAHSGSLAVAVSRGVVRDIETLRAFCDARLHSAGALSALFANRAQRSAHDPSILTELDNALDIRMISSASRMSSRAQGNGLVRVASTTWPSASLAHIPSRAHHAIALGVCVAVVGGSAKDAAVIASTNSITANCSAAVRLLGLDPFSVSKLQAEFGVAITDIAESVSTLDDMEINSLPAFSSPGLDLLAQAQTRLEVRLFAS